MIVNTAPLSVLERTTLKSHQAKSQQLTSATPNPPPPPPPPRSRNLSTSMAPPFAKIYIRHWVEPVVKNLLTRSTGPLKEVSTRTQP